MLCLRKPKHRKKASTTKGYEKSNKLFLNAGNFFLFLDKTQLVEQTEQIAQSGLQELIKCKLYLLKSNVA